MLQIRRKSGKRGEDAGFVLLVAIVVTVIVLAIGLSIIDIAVREFQLSRLVVESQRAYATADFGIDCAVDADFSKRPFPSPLVKWGASYELDDVTNPGGNLYNVYGKKYWSSSPSDPIKCNGQTLKMESFTPKSESISVGNFNYYTIGLETIYFDASDLKEPCVDIVIRKIMDSGSNKVGTEIEAIGYNTCDPTQRQVQRAVCLRWSDKGFNQAFNKCGGSVN